MQDMVTIPVHLDLQVEEARQVVRVEQGAVAAMACLVPMEPIKFLVRMELLV
jgi:hypothetical protein